MKPIKILVPFSYLYGFFIKIRNFLYDKKIFSIHRFSQKVKIISVGNIVAGGSGKTPFTMYLAQLLRDQGKKVAILSRGYGRTTKGFLLVSDGREIKVSVTAAGDEPYLMAHLLKNIPVAVSEDRSVGIKKLLTLFAPDIILLDDAFQHRKVYRDLDIVLHPARTEFAYTHLLPAGYLREPFSSLSRADVIILTKGNSIHYQQVKKYLQKKYNGIFTKWMDEILFFDFKIFKFEHHKKQIIQWDTLPNRAMAVAGIANPDDFFSTCRGRGIEIVQELRYPDHFIYSDDEIQDWIASGQVHSCFNIVTTFKDFVKIKPFIQNEKISFYIIEPQIRLQNEEEFLNLLKGYNLF